MPKTARLLIIVLIELTVVLAFSVAPASAGRGGEDSTTRRTERTAEQNEADEPALPVDRSTPGKVEQHGEEDEFTEAMIRWIEAQLEQDPRTIEAEVPTLEAELVEPEPIEAELEIHEAQFPSIEAGPASVVEGDAGLRSLAFPVDLGVACPVPVTITFHILSWGPDPATGGSDFFEMTDAKKTVPAGQSQTTLSALVFGDQLVEPDEHVILFIDDVDTCTTLSGGVEIAFGTIVDDDDFELAALDLLADFPFAGGPDDPADPQEPVDPQDPVDGEDPQGPEQDPEPTGPTTGDDPEPTEPADDESGGEAAGSSASRGALPLTGASTMTLVPVGALLLCAGGGLTLAARRRR